ncbi:hypothetical protein Clacol_005455 [Clathrus columnatus]|uniref:Uncharacterized protein n=1 Tax=Clathrus columnatus TaxID=1419009 RepID=A0AAV5ACN7_9AGAM|nr:hypothetical protein Clacol_005455 [Clathrus columnatus]
MGFVRMTVGPCREQVIDLRRLRKSPGSYKLDFTNGFHLTLTIEWLGKMIELPNETRNIPFKQSKSVEPADVSLYNTPGNQENEAAWLSFLSCIGSLRSLAEEFPEVTHIQTFEDQSYVAWALNILSVIPDETVAQSKYSNTVNELSQHLQEVYKCIIGTIIGANEVTQHQCQALLVLIEQTIESAYFVLELDRIKTVSTVRRGVDIAGKAKDLHEKLNHITRQTQVCLSHLNENRPGPASIQEIRFF